MHSCSQCGAIFTRKNNLTRHETMNRCKKSAVKRSNPYSTPSDETYRSPSVQHYSVPQEQSQHPEQAFDLTKNPKTEAMKNNTNVQALLDAVINDGIPSNKSLNEPVLKITPSFNESMVSSILPLEETIVELEKPIVIPDYMFK